MADSDTTGIIQEGETIPASCSEQELYLGLECNCATKNYTESRRLNAMRDSHCIASAQDDWNRCNYLCFLHQCMSTWWLTSP